MAEQCFCHHEDQNHPCEENPDQDECAAERGVHESVGLRVDLAGDLGGCDFSGGGFFEELVQAVDAGIEVGKRLVGVLEQGGWIGAQQR